MKVFNLLTACAIVAPLLFVSCSDDNMGEIDQPSVADGPVTFSLGLGVVSQPRQMSRALPHEPGYDYENNIEDAIVIIYDTPLNSSGGHIVYSNYFNTSNLTKDDSFTGAQFAAKVYDNDGGALTVSNAYTAVNRYTFEFGADLTDGATYYILALANVGNLSFTSLDDLRNYVYKGKICSAAGYPEDCHRFAMSAISEEKFTFDRTQTVNHDFMLPDLYVQRLAARIDLVFGKRGSSKDDLNNGNVDYVILDNPGTGLFSSNEQSVYFPVYDAENGNRISGAVFALDELYISSAVDDVAGEYLLERNLRYGTTWYLGNDDFNTETGYANCHVWTPEFDTNSFITHPELFANKGGKKPNSNTQYYGFMGESGRIHYLADGTETVVLGYVRENTYQEYSESNRYTSVCLVGRSNIENGHFDGNSTTATGGNKHVLIPVRHSIGALDTSKPLAYGIVRNTIYRIKIRFYAKGDTIYARYYYYGTLFDGKEDKTDLNENKYNDIPFYNFILEGDGTAPND